MVGIDPQKNARQHLFELSAARRLSLALFREIGRRGKSALWGELRPSVYLNQCESSPAHSHLGSSLHAGGASALSADALPALVAHEKRLVMNSLQSQPQFFSERRVQICSSQFLKPLRHSTTQSQRHPESKGVLRKIKSAVMRRIVRVHIHGEVHPKLGLK